MSVLSRAWLFDGIRGARYRSDDCDYSGHAKRIATYQITHTPESVLPFVSAFGEYPDSCSFCGKATIWESRRLADGCFQTRCTECRSVVTFS